MLDPMLGSWKSTAIVLATVLATGCSTSSDTAAASPKLYIFDCGSIDGVSPAGFGLKAEEIAVPGFFTPCYLIVHPKGTLIWDTGQIPDANLQAGAATKQGPFTVTKPFLPQLAAVGYQPSQITYLALSHYHWDHVANANDFARATWLVRQSERDGLFPNPQPTPPYPSGYAYLQNSKTTLITADEHDVFGDGAVVIKSSPGHTPGHQVLYVKLPRTGGVVLAGDLYHYPEERTLNRLPTTEFNEQQTRRSREELEAFLKKTGAQLWIQHDLTAHATLRKSPEYYD